MMRPFNVGVILSLAFLVVGSLAVDVVTHQRTAGISRECRHGELRDWGVLLSGGGIRATAAGYSALQALEEVKVHRDKKTTMTALEGVHTIVGISGGSWALTTAMAQDYNFKKLDNLVKKTVETQKGFGNMNRFKQVRCKSSECHVQWTQELKDKVFPGFIPKADFWKESYSKKVDECAAPSASVAFSVWDCPNTIPGSGKDENCRSLGYCHVTDGAKEPMMRCNDYRKEVAPATKSHKAEGWAKAVPVSSLGNRRNINTKGTHLDPLDIWELMGYSSSAWSAVNSDPTVEVEPVLIGKIRNPQVALLPHASKNNVHDEAERRGHVRADPNYKKTKSNSQPHPIYPMDAKAAAVYPGIQPIDKDASRGLLLSDEGGYCNLGFPSLFTPESPGSYVRILAFDAGDNKDNKDDPLGVELTKCFHFHRMEPDKKRKAIEEQLTTAFDRLYKNKKLYKYVHTENGISYVCGSFADFTTTKYDTGTFTLEYCNKDRRNLVIAMTEVEGNIIYYFPIRGSDNVYIPDEFPTVKVTLGKILKFKVGEPNYFETYEEYDSVRQRLRRFYKLALCFANYDADDRCEKYKFKVDHDEQQSHLTDRFKPGKKK